MAFGLRGSLPRFGRPLWVLLSSFLVQHTGYYLALPFLMIIFTTQFGLTAGQAGLVLGAISLSYLLAGVVGGPLSDRVGRRFAMVLGLSLQAAGFLAYAWARPFPAMLAVSALVGGGGGLFAPAARAGIAALSAGESERTTAFSVRGIAANLGMSIGPLLGALLVGKPLFFFGAAAAFHAALALALPFVLPAGCERGACPRGATAAIMGALRNGPFVLFSLAVVVIASLDAQMTTALPLRVADITGRSGSIGFLATLNSLLIVALQLPISAWLLRRLHPMTAMAVGILVTGAGLASIAWAGSMVYLAGSVALVALGQMLFIPTIDSAVSAFARGEAIGTYFGLSTLVWGLGTAAGNVIGGQAVTAARQLANPVLPWLLFAGMAAAAALGLAILGRWPALRKVIRGEALAAGTAGTGMAVRWQPEDGPPLQEPARLGTHGGTGTE